MGADLDELEQQPTPAPAPYFGVSVLREEDRPPRIVIASLSFKSNLLPVVLALEEARWLVDELELALAQAER